MDSDIEVESDISMGRKRTREDTDLPDSDSDTATEQSIAVKCSSARRGKSLTKGRGSGLTRARAELRAKKLEADEEAFEKSLQSRAFRKKPEAVVSEIEDSSDTQNATFAVNLGAEELRAGAGRNVALIMDVAKKSNNIKGTLVKKLKDSAAALQEIVETLASRTETEETRRLRADNSRLRTEVENLKTELKAHRREFSEMRTSLTAASVLEPSGLPKNLLDDLKGSIVASIGVMIDARFAGIEERLLPAQTIRPPLASDQRKQVSQSSRETESASIIGPVLRSAAARKKTTAKTISAGHKHSNASSSDVLKTGPSTAISSLIVPPVSTENAEITSQLPNDSWSTVVRRGKKGKRSQGDNLAEASATNSSNVSKSLVVKPVVQAKKKLSVPRTSAVVTTLQSEALERGITYAHVLEQAEQSIKLDELGIGAGLRIRQAATGARVLELPKGHTPEQAELLATKLRVILDGVADVIRPTKCADLRLSGLDDSVNKEKVIAAVARVGNCPKEVIKVGEIQPGFGNMGMIRVTCPIGIAKTLSTAGKILVGWSSAKVQALEERPMRCFKCQSVGHTKPLCPSSVDRSGLCFRCGSVGHKSQTCKNELHCVVCAEAGKPAGHYMGSRECNPPHIKGKVVIGTRIGPRDGGQQANEDVNMLS